MTKQFDYEDEYITLDGGVFAEVRSVNDAELISKTFNQLIDENEELKEDVDYWKNRFKEEEWHYEHIDEDRDVWHYKCTQLEKENEQLKQQLIDCEEKKQNIKDVLLHSEAVVEQKKIQELVYNIVFDCIDEKIEEYKKYDGYDTEKYYIGTQLLKELKRELKGDVE